jgi:hypothetical protein
LRTVVDDGLSEGAQIRQLLAVLKGAGWTLEKRRAFAESDAFREAVDLRKNREVVDQALDVAVLLALIDQLLAGEFEVIDDGLSTLVARSYEMKTRLSVRATDSVDDLLHDLQTELNIRISGDLDLPEVLLVEWDEETWRQLIQVLSEHADELVNEVSDSFKYALTHCLEEGSLIPLRERSVENRTARQTRLRKLERDLAHGALSFDLGALKPDYPGAQPSGLETSRPGGGRGSVSGGVNEDQATRGRVAELFVLQACWMRFLESDRGQRERILDKILYLRREGSGTVEDHVRWSTKTASRDLEKRLGKDRERLLSHPSSPPGACPPLPKLFKDLIEVADERGPGYDVLDPFGVWGEPKRRVQLDPRRVEIKAVLQREEVAATHRVILSTNEFHRASRNPDSYVLRLIAVPQSPEAHLNQVYWVCDIRNPVDRLNLREQMSRGVRGGSLPLRLRFEA